MEKEGVKILETKENKPNAETSKVFEDTDKNKNLNLTTGHQDLLEKVWT